MANILEIILRAKDEISKVLKDSSKNIKKTGEDFQKMGQSMTLAGAAVSAGLGIAVKSAANFQAEMAFVSTQLDETTTKLLPQFQKQLADMAVEFGESTATLSRGLFDILSASVSAEKAMGVLEASVRASKAGITDTAVSADALTTIINSFGLAAEDAGDVSDFLFKTVLFGKTTFDQLAPVIGRVASLANLGGLSMEEMGAALATMTRAGISTEEAVTSLRGIINSFISPTDEAAAAAKELGVELSANALKSEGLIGTITKLSSATAKQQADMFPNIRAFSGLATIVGDTNGFMQNTIDITNRVGATQEALSKITDTLNDRGKRLFQGFTQLNRELVDGMIPTLESLFEGMIKIFNVFRKLPEPIQNILAGLTAVNAILLTVGGSAFFVVGKTLILIAAIKESTTFMKIFGVVTKLAFIELAIGVAIIIAANEAMKALLKNQDKNIKQTENFLVVQKEAKKLRDSGNLSIEKERELTQLLAEGRKDAIKDFLDNNKKELKAKEDSVKATMKLKKEEEKRSDAIERKILNAIELEKNRFEKFKENQKEEAEEREGRISEEEGRIKDEFNLRRQLREFDLKDVINTIEKQIEAEKLGSEERIALENSLAEFKKALNIETAADISQIQDGITENLRSNIASILLAEQDLGTGIGNVWENIKKTIIDTILKTVIEEKAAAVIRIGAEQAVAAAKAISAYAGIPFIGLALGIAAVVGIKNQIDKQEFHEGGTVQGPIGSEQVITAKAGEKVLTRKQQTMGSMSGNGLTVVLQINGTLVEGDRTKWDRLLRTNIFPAFQRFLSKTNEQFSGGRK